MNKVFNLYCIPLLLPLIVLQPGCSSTPHDPAAPDALEWKRSTWQTLKAGLELPLSRRILPVPERLMADVIGNDLDIGITSAQNYATRPASFIEASLYHAYLALLPERYISLMDDKLLAIFLVENFAGAGYTDWVIDERGEPYYYMILNPDLFRYSVDEWMTYREDSIFEPRRDGEDEYHLRVVTDVDHTAMLYALMHEGAHLMDYEYGITPVVEELFSKTIGRGRNHSPFSENVWASQTQPLAIYDYEGRKGLNVYGIFPERGRLARSEVPRMFKELRLTPFVSHYASTNWAEHLADYVMYWHIEHRLLGRVTLQLWRGNQLQDQYYPLLATLQPKNARVLKIIYGSE